MLASPRRSGATRCYYGFMRASADPTTLPWRQQQGPTTSHSVQAPPRQRATPLKERPTATSVTCHANAPNYMNHPVYRDFVDSPEPGFPVSAPTCKFRSTKPAEEPPRPASGFWVKPLGPYPPTRRPAPTIRHNTSCRAPAAIATNQASGPEDGPHPSVELVTAATSPGPGSHQPSRPPTCPRRAWRDG